MIDLNLFLVAFGRLPPFDCFLNLQPLLKTPQCSPFATQQRRQWREIETCFRGEQDQSRKWRERFSRQQRVGILFGFEQRWEADCQSLFAAGRSFQLFWGWLSSRLMERTSSEEGLDMQCFSSVVVCVCCSFLRFSEPCSCCCREMLFQALFCFVSSVT